MFYFRINKLKVIDNRTTGFLFFKKDLADVKILSFVTTGNDDLPNIDAWMHAEDPAKKKNFLASAVTSLAASRVLTTVESVRDNHSLFFGDTGYVLYQSQAIPDDFNWCFTAVKSQRDENEFGQMLEEVVNDSEFDTFADNLGTLVMGAASPIFAAGVEVAKYTASTVSKILQEAGDEQLGILYMSLNRNQHYLHGERKKDDVSDLSGNLHIDYSIFAVS